MVRAWVAVNVVLASIAFCAASPTARADVPRGAPLTAILIHGGGWLQVGPHYVATMEQLAYRYRRRRIRVFNIDYASGGEASLASVTATYDKIRRRVSGPIVAVGASAGGQLALMLARRRALAGVVAYAAPTDLVHSTSWLRLAVDGAFAPPDLRRYSPALVGVPRRTPILGIYTSDDPLVPPPQAHALRRLGAKVDMLAPGPLDLHFMHTGVSPRGWARAALDERRFLDRVVARTPRPRGGGRSRSSRPPG
jgi:acetyl esterase/lipase